MKARLCALLALWLTATAPFLPAVAQPPTPPSDLLDAAQASIVLDAEEGLRLAREARAVERMQLQPRTRILLRAAWLEGESLFRLGRFDEAEKALIASLMGLETEGSDLTGKLLITRGRIARAQGENGEALRRFQEAYDTFLSTKNTRYQAISLQSIGTLYANAGQYGRAIEYDERAAEVHTGDPMITIVSLNNRGNALRRLGRYEQARAMFREALSLPFTEQSPAFAVRLHTNLAALELAAGEDALSLGEVSEALTLASALQDKQVPRLAYAVAAQLARRSGDIDRAVRVLDQAFGEPPLDQNKEDDKEAHGLAAEVYEAADRPELALVHLKAFKFLEDRERDVAASANLAILNARFELSNKELEISQLKSETLEADVALIKANRRMERGLAAGASLAGLVAIAVLFLRYRQALKLRKLTEQYSAELSSANEALVTSNHNLEIVSNAKTEFLATTSHEVRTPLNAVINLTAAVIGKLPKGSEEHQHLRTALQSAEHLHAIVSDVLDVARFEGGRVEAHLRPVDLADVTSSIVDLWRPKATEKGLDFGIDVHLNRRPFLTDEKLLRQVLSNLISNAIKFTSAGHVRLKLLGGGPTQPLTIEVHDTGIGIAPKDQPVIFDSFKQVDGSRTRSYGGTGLGLAICRQITELLEGTIRVESKEGQGASFFVELPALRVEAHRGVSSAIGSNQTFDETALSGLSILVAEDNAINAMVIETILKSAVPDLTFVENGAEAVAAVEGGSFDVVLMDKQMPVMDGVEATKRIRSLSGEKGSIPIIAVTADAFEAAKNELLAAGCDDYLSKPIGPKNLKHAIIANSRLRSEDIDAAAGRTLVS